MFRHRGKNRTLVHNLKIASLLSFIAGLVNVVGFLSIQRLTTNVTGHFAFFIDNIFKHDFLQSIVYFLYIYFFFLGSFASSLLIETIARINERYVYVVPISLECLILFIIGIYGHFLSISNPDTIAFCLLFAMGLQNSLVTTISSATVRTTHLTGLFTDLGIELSQLFFYKLKEHRTKLLSSIKLRLNIITFFFIGGIVGGVLYLKIELKALIIASAILIIGLIYDDIKFKLILLRRNLKSKN